MRRLILIGIGAGDPRQLTLEAINAMEQLDVCLFLDKRSAARELGDVREKMLEQFASPSIRQVHLQDPVRSNEAGNNAGHYVSNVKDWHQARVTLLEKALHSEVPADGTAGMLIWGDPGLYDSAIRLAHQIIERDNVQIELEIIPGISCIQLLCARFSMPMNQLNGPIHITTGRRLRDEGIPPHVDEVFVMLDGECSFDQLNEPDMRIYWGAYLGLPDEILIEGKVSEVADHIRQRRVEARKKKGWIMDTYRLVRTS